MSFVPLVMVVDGDPRTREQLHAFVTARGHGVAEFANLDAAVYRFKSERPAAVILDVATAGGIDALAEFKRIDRDVPVIVLSAPGRTTTVVQAMKLGAADVVSKPFEERDLEQPLANALTLRALTRDVATLRHELETDHRNLLYGVTDRMRDVRALVERIADADLTVLIRGENGTGKELVARALAASSSRRDKPFVKVNCAALPTELLESELFGFERGAFTGAIQQKPGKFEFANHGTLFLDEVGEMPLASQAKLLHVLQDGEFSRPGGTRGVQVDVRIIAATSRDLERAVAEGTFREDLFARFNVVSISLPPLRERRDDISELAEHFLKTYAVRYNKRYVQLSSDTMRLFQEYDWPGNIRELENMSKRAVVLGDDSAVNREIAQAIASGKRRRAEAGTHVSPGAGAVPAAAGAAVAAAGSETVETGHYSLKDISRTAAREAERELILKMLHQTRWNRKETAEMLGISYKALLYKIKENGLDKAS